MEEGLKEAWSARVPGQWFDIEGNRFKTAPGEQVCGRDGRIRTGDPLLPKQVR